MTTTTRTRSSLEEPSTDQSPFAGLLTLEEAGRLFPNGGRSPSTMWDLCRRGRVRGGSTVRLQYLRIGRALMIEPAALRTFAEQLAAAERAQDEARDAKSHNAGKRRAS